MDEMDSNALMDEKLAGNAVLRGTAHLKRRATLMIVIGLVSVALLYVFSMTMGAYSLSFMGAWEALKEIIFNGGPESTDAKVLYYSRMPRSLSVIMVGAGLAVAGAVMQALIRNPLVDPYITGVSSGASFGVLLFTIGGASIAAVVSLNYIIPVVAIIGAIGAFMLTMTVAEASGGRAMNYVLGGVIIASGISAGTTLLTSLNIEELHSISAWLFGSFANIRWEQAWLIFFPVMLVLLFISYNARQLNMMLLGEEQAQYLGMSARTYKRNMMIVVASLTALCVAFCGVIGFVGLIVPHLTRMVVGGDHRLLLPACMVVGANILLAADIFCKSALNYVELPIGAIISVIGVPLFIYLMMKEGKKYAM